MILQAGTNPTIDIQIVDDSGLPVTGLNATTFPTISYVIAGAHASINVTLNDLALITTAYTSGGVKERSGGYYRLDLPTDAIATAATQVRVIGEASGKRVICPAIDVTPATAAIGDFTATQKTSITAAVPTVVQTRQEIDANSSQLVSILTAIQNVQNNTFIASSIPTQIQTPVSGSVLIQVSFVFYDETGHSKNLDSGNPAITLVNGYGTDRSSRLGSWTNPVTGKYVISYANTSTDSLENLEWDVSGTINGVLRRLPAATQIVNTIAVDFTSTDRTTLNALATTLGTNGSGLTSLGDTRLANLDATISSRLLAASYVPPTTPPNVVQIRQEMDANSERLANLDATVSSRLPVSGYTMPPTVSAIQSGLSTHADAVSIVNGISALGSPLQTSDYVAPPTPPTVVEIRQEMDANSTRLAASATSAGITAASQSILSVVGSPLQASSYIAPPSATLIAATTASVLFVDGAASPLKVNPDHTVSSLAAGGIIANYITVPAAVAAASQDASVITCIRGDTLRMALPLMGNLIGRTKLVITVKATLSDSDTQAVFQVVEGTGLTRLNGGVPTDASSAKLFVANDSTGAANLTVNANITAALGVRDLVWDVQAILPTGVITPIRGTLTVVADVTQSVT